MITIENKNWQRGATFLNVTYPILCGAMSWVSESSLVSAISNAGGFGIIACGALSPEMLREEIRKTKEKTQKSFGVNLITMHPQIMDLIEVCINEKVQYVVLAGGLPKSSQIIQLKDNGVKTLCFAPTLKLAVRLVQLGVDALIIEGMEAGGHIGPVSTSVLVQEILPHIKEVPVFIAGGIGRGEMVASYIKIGASGCQLGTKFVCANESIAHPRFKEAFINASARDAVTSVQLDAEFPIIPVRALANNATKQFLEVQKKAVNEFREGNLSKKEAQLQIEHFWAGALKKAVIDGDIENGSVMAGQSVAFIEKEQSAKEIIEELVTQTKNAL
jgi:enoyl-[acyl-carrier protein] reductase II